MNQPATEQKAPGECICSVLVRMRRPQLGWRGRAHPRWTVPLLGARRKLCKVSTSTSVVGKGRTTVEAYSLLLGKSGTSPTWTVERTLSGCYGRDVVLEKTRHYVEQDEWGKREEKLGIEKVPKVSIGASIDVRGGYKASDHRRGLVPREVWGGELLESVKERAGWGCLSNEEDGGAVCP